MHNKTVETNNLKGIAFMLTSSFSTALLLSLAKIISKDISSNYAVFFYKVLVLMMILPWVFKNGISAIHTKKLGLYVIGAVFSTTASICLIYSLSSVPLVNATCLGYLEKVILVAIGMFFFNETCSLVRIIAVFFCFLGAVIVINPDILHGKQLLDVELSCKYIPVFASILLWVLYCLVTKIIGRTESDKTQIFYNTFFSVIISLGSLSVDWKPVIFMSVELMQPQGLKPLNFVVMKGGDYILLQIMAICYLIRSIASFKALQFSDLSVVVPFGYAKVFFSGMLGVILFNQYPAKESYIGYGIILISVYCLFRNELHNRGKIQVKC